MGSATPSAAQRLVFIDTETTGLDPAVDRIIEIGVVTVDRDTADEWTTLLNPRCARAQSSRLLQEIGEDRARCLPRFGEVADLLRERIKGGLLIAHNARFDYGFLKAEFERVGIQFQAEVLCSLMLSKRLSGRHDRHDLASLVERHGLASGVRHRALPDAQALYQLWQKFQQDYPRERIETLVQDLLAGPVLPADLDSAREIYSVLVAKLPRLARRRILPLRRNTEVSLESPA